MDSEESCDLAAECTSKKAKKFKSLSQWNKNRYLRFVFTSVELLCLQSFTIWWSKSLLCKSLCYPITEGLKLSTRFPLRETRELSHGQFDFLFFLTQRKMKIRYAYITHMNSPQVFTCV